jgi:hypothetical protein
MGEVDRARDTKLNSSGVRALVIELVERTIRTHH